VFIPAVRLDIDWQASIWISLAALLVASVLGAIKIWETFLVRPRLTVRFEWITSADPFKTLRFYVVNTGRVPVVIEEVRFLTSDTPVDQGWLWFDSVTRGDFPRALQPRDASPVIYMQAAEPGVDSPNDLRNYFRDDLIVAAAVVTIERSVRTRRYSLPGHDG
jgi:hypothetical protein